MRIYVPHHEHYSPAVEPLRVHSRDIHDTPTINQQEQAAGEKLADWVAKLPDYVRDGFRRRLSSKYGIRFGG